MFTDNVFDRRLNCYAQFHHPCVELLRLCTNLLIISLIINEETVDTAFLTTRENVGSFRGMYNVSEYTHMRYACDMFESIDRVRVNERN